MGRQLGPGISTIASFNNNINHHHYYHQVDQSVMVDSLFTIDFTLVFNSISLSSTIF